MSGIGTDASSSFVDTGIVENMDIDPATEGGIALSFLQNVNFREGYSYTLHFFFNETTAVSEPTVCDGSAIGHPHNQNCS